ncbi:WecB/TagA/CpsF family glycosyltransferase [soil metagenome]
MADSTSFISARVGPDRRDDARPEFRKIRRAEERIRLLGQPIDLVKPEEVLHHMQRWILQRKKAVVANHNLNSLALMRLHPEMNAFYERAELIELDSTPLVYFARLLGLHSRPFHRCTYLDWRDHFWSLVNRNGWRVMYVGGTQEVLDVARDRLLARYPRARITGCNGYFDSSAGSADTRDILDQMALFQPHILFVGMGMPRQELWIEQNFDALPDCVIFSVGAAFDYEAGAQKPAPRWMGRMGVEWLFRLLADPKRLAKRYLVEPWGLMDLIVADMAGAVRRKFKPQG